MYWSVIDTLGGEIADVNRKVPGVRMVRGEIRRVSFDCDRAGETNFLPTRGALVGERRLGQQLPIVGPQTSHVRAGVRGGFVELDAGDVAIEVRAEPYAQGGGDCFSVVDNGRGHIWPDVARTIRRCSCRGGGKRPVYRSGHLIISAIFSAADARRVFRRRGQRRSWLKRHGECRGVIGGGAGCNGVA